MKETTTNEIHPNSVHPCLCDVCLKARGEELKRLRDSVLSLKAEELNKELERTKVEVEAPTFSIPLDPLIAGDQAFNKGLEIAQKLVADILK
ncbi:MAG: hypothetical protein V4481_05140 [Patescibacteria group bacterium]